MNARCLILTLLVLVPAASAGAQTVTPPSITKATCGPGSIPEPGLQGRVAKADVDSGAAAAGYRCNIEAIGHSGETGGFRVFRYVDKAGHECAYYDTTLLFPTNTLNLSLQPTGVAVLDMSDPTKPVRTATLVTPAMQTPHESLNISTERGILAAVMGTPAVAPGQVDVYDISGDCRAPVLKSSAPVGYLGHESGMAPDGKTFYANSLSTGGTTAVDIGDPVLTRSLGRFDTNSHGMSVSDDGTRGYMASTDGLRVYDLSQVQQRKADPQAPLISKLTWPTLTIPQVTLPFTRDGHHYLGEVDEYSTSDTGGYTANGPRVGAARIIDIEDETHPSVVSDIRLEVHQPENRAAIAGDYGAQNPTQGYAGHYCQVSSEVDPVLMACSMILSGLRVFDIRDPAHPKEVAYYLAPPDTISLTGAPVIDERANWAMSQPAFVPERKEIWYSDGTSGFHVLRLTNDAWPDDSKAAENGAVFKACRSKRAFTIHIKHPSGDRTRTARVKVDGKRVKVRKGARHYTARIDLRGIKKKVVVVKIVSRTRSGKIVRETRRYRTCRPGGA
ncbi:MAG: LVIVD repeat-containing protein [Solirubrobacteraceae bacterium]